MSKENTESFWEEHKVEAALAVGGLMGAIGVVVAKKLRDLHEDADEGPGVSEDPSGNS
jgi:hypothetical protein